VLLGYPDGGGALSGIQGASAANSPPLALTVMSSNGNVGHVGAHGDTAATVTFDLAPGEFEPQLAFVSRSGGPTTVSASIPGFLVTPAASADLFVGGPGIHPYTRTLGAALQYTSDATLDISNHGGVTVRVESGNSGTLLIAPNGNTPGASFIDVFVPDGENRASYTVQGVAGTTGMITVTASAPGFTDGTATIDVVQPGVAIFGLETTRAVGNNDAFTVFVGVPDGTGTFLSGYQGMSAANLPPLTLVVESSDGTVGVLSAAGNTDATILIDMTAGMFQPDVIFQPLSAGPTTVSAFIPGFLSTTSATVAITVN
jgi:hypothetical protein